MTAAARTGAELPDARWVADWLTSLGQKVDEEPAISRIGLGYSNLTFMVSVDDGRRWVLRRPPFGITLASAHNVLREARIMHALQGTRAPVPAILGVRQEEASWVLMEHIDGTVVDEMAVARSLDHSQRGAIAISMAETLATVHEVDIDAVGLGDLSKRTPYAARQIRRWNMQLDAVGGQELAGLADLATRLSAKIPTQTETTLVHGDYHIKNVISRDDAVVGILDWELSTLGDPLADIGTLLAYWPHGGEMAAADRTAPSTLPGFPSRTELVDAYARRSGRDVSDVEFWHVLGLWKIAIIGAGVRRRSVDNPGERSLGETPSASDIDSLVEFARATADNYNL